MHKRVSSSDSSGQIAKDSGPWVCFHGTRTSDTILLEYENNTLPGTMMEVEEGPLDDHVSLP